MINSSISGIKRSQKESLFLREMSKMFHRIAMENQELLGLSISRVQLSANKGWLSVYFYTPDGYEAYKKQFEVLKLYKPSIRKGLGVAISSRYVPDLKFEYDSKFEKLQNLELALDNASKDIKKNEDDE